ncbi:hypothetical protein BGZ92_002403 [Podila epicladia]|nr:hypothetical protein BGZ92_002403 [Podila epicladia]
MVRNGLAQPFDNVTASPTPQGISPSALKSSTSLSSEATSTESSSPRESTDSAENEKSEDLKDPDPPSIDDISVVPHDRSRTLPAILPSGLLWSLTRVLGTKKADAPLNSDTSDTDSSDDTSDDDLIEKPQLEATFAKPDATTSDSSPAKIQQPSMPERAALSARTNSRDRVVVSEAQVLIGEDLDDENDPFTDSHALPSSVGASPASQSSKDSYKQSTPSPSLSATTLSYLTGTAASGSTWSLQSSGQSLMKRIFKSKNEPTISSSPDPNVEPSTPPTASQTSAAATSLRGSTSPSAVFAPDPFSDFDQEFNTEGSEGLASISTGNMKRRSFIIPGAFPGFGASQPEDSSEEPSEPEHVPMYSPSAGEVLVTRIEATKRRSYVIDDTDIWPSVELLNTSRSDGSHSPNDKSSLSALESELPRYYPASPTQRPRAYSQHLTNPMLGANSLDSPFASQEPHKDKSSTLSPAGVSRSPQPPKKESGHSPKAKSSSSPSVLSIAQAPATLTSPVHPTEMTTSPLTPPLAPMAPSVVSDMLDRSEISEERKDQILDSTIDYTRYKEEITESNYARYSWPGEKPFKTESQATDSSDMSESIVSSDQSSGSSPLIVEVVSSGLRSSSQDSRHMGATSAPNVARSGTAQHSFVPQQVHSLHQTQLKNNPPPPPPPRNARRPRSKTLGKYPSKDKLEAVDDSSQSRSFSSAEVSSSNSPWDEPSSMDAQASVHVPHLTMVLTANSTNNLRRPEIPGKEVIMEEMGSSEARNFNDGDHHYYQRDKRGLELQTALLPTQSGAWSASSQHSDPSSANEAMLVATLRNQIASLASERDQFYQEAMLLRQKHDMLSNIVNNMGVAVESIQAQQQQQQQQQHILQQQQQFQSQTMSSLSSMTAPVIAASGRGDAVVGPNPYPHAHQQQGRLEYGQFQETQSQFSAYQQPQGSDQYLRPHDQLQMHQHHHTHFPDVEQDIRVRQLSDEYSIQISRNSEDFGSRDYYLQQQTQLDHGVNNLGYAHIPDQNVHSGFLEESRSSYLGMAPQVHQHQQEQHQIQHPQQVQQGQPLMFGEGYDILSSADNNIPEQASLSALGQLDYNTQRQMEEDQMRSGLTLQQLKLQHQQNQESQYRISTDTRHSSRQSSMDGFQLTDIITTRPMSGSFVIAEPVANHQPPEYGYGFPQQASSQGYDGTGRPVSFREQHHNHVQQELDQCPPGSHLRRHHSMIYPQTSARQSSSSLDMMQQQQQGSHGRSQPRPPVWASNNLNRSSTTGSGQGQHRRQMSNPQEIPPPVEKELLLLSSSTSFLNNNDMYGVESPPMSSAGLNNHSLLSAVVQQEKVRIEEKTSAKNGAAGWSERPSPMISKSKDPQPTSSTTPAALRQPTHDDTNRRDTNRIREQFDSYLSDGRLHQKDSAMVADQHNPDAGQPFKGPSEIDSNTDSDDEMEEIRLRRGQGGVTGSSIAVGGAIGRSKAIASSGVHHPDSSAHSKLSNVGSTADSLVRHHSSSGSLRSVARHSELRRGDGSTKTTISAPLTVDKSAIGAGTTGTKIEISPLSSESYLATNSSQTDDLAGTGPSHRQYPLKASSATPTVTRPSKLLDLSPVMAKKPLAHMVDEEGGDYWGSEMQAQPRRYNSVKLGMTGSLHGVTRRAIGRPAVERGRSMERGPEDCV